MDRERPPAPGVESEQVLNELARLGCDIVQGYHLSRPLPADQLTQWLASTRSTGPAYPADAAAPIDTRRKIA